MRQTAGSPGVQVPRNWGMLRKVKADCRNAGLQGEVIKSDNALLFKRFICFSAGSAWPGRARSGCKAIRDGFYDWNQPAAKGSTGSQNAKERERICAGAT